MSLVASGNSIFKGRCYVCRNWGHKSNQCPYRNKINTQNRQTIQNKATMKDPTNTNCNTNSNPNPTWNNANNYIPPRTPRFQGKYYFCKYEFTHDIKIQGKSILFYYYVIHLYLSFVLFQMAFPFLLYLIQ